MTTGERPEFILRIVWIGLLSWNKYIPSSSVNLAIVLVSHSFIRNEYRIFKFIFLWFRVVIFNSVCYFRIKMFFLCYQLSILIRFINYINFALFTSAAFKWNLLSSSLIHMYFSFLATPNVIQGNFQFLNVLKLFCFSFFALPPNPIWKFLTGIISNLIGNRSIMVGRNTFLASRWRPN